MSPEIHTTVYTVHDGVYLQTITQLENGIGDCRGDLLSVRVDLGQGREEQEGEETSKSSTRLDQEDSTEID